MEVNRAGTPKSDLLVASGAITYGGTLEIVEGTNDFYASLGDAFPNLVTANGGLSGSFASVIIPADVSFTINQAGTVGITGGK